MINKNYQLVVGSLVLTLIGTAHAEISDLQTVSHSDKPLIEFLSTISN